MDKDILMTCVDKLCTHLEDIGKEIWELRNSVNALRETAQEQTEQLAHLVRQLPKA